VFVYGDDEDDGDEVVIGKFTDKRGNVDITRLELGMSFL
jgi:hypothetical protein